MDRTVPNTGSEEIELYIKTYYSLLRSSADIQIRTLEEVHAGMGSALHPSARGSEPDLGALIYSSLRLPPCMPQVERVILGQSQEVFQLRGVGDIESWQPAPPAARRRRSFFDGQDTLACYIASRSDIDDIIPLLTAFQIEWNKLHGLMQGDQLQRFLEAPSDDLEGLAALSHAIGVPAGDLERLRGVWGAAFWPLLRAIAGGKKRLRVRLLASTLNDYRRATELWWEQVEASNPNLLHRPVYFVSSNTHSLANLLTGFALRQREELLAFIQGPGEDDLLAEWEDIQARQVPSSPENFLYYALKSYVQTPQGQHLQPQIEDVERRSGITRVPSEHSFDVEAQVIDLSQLDADGIDPRLPHDLVERLRASQSYIVNIDYPLGMAAYLLLTSIASRVGDLRGVFIVGKAATLNGVIGDVMIPSVVFDEQSHNTYLFENCFRAGDVEADLVYGTVLDNQKAVSVRGTFLQTPKYIDVFYREGYTDIEMEAGPYLSAIYEMARPKRYPTDEIVNLHELPFELGILHYASDTPLSKGRNLGAGSLSYYGMDPTYAASLAVLRRILVREVERMDTNDEQLAAVVDDHI
jgi:hypothetical protein